MQYTFEPPPLLQFDGRGRASVAEATFGPTTPGQNIPGSVQVSLKIKGYPRWRGVKGAMRSALMRPISSPADTASLARALSARFYPAFREFFLVFALDSRLKVLSWYLAAIGTGSTVQVSAQDIFRNLVILPTSAFIVVHNHPSGDATPSPEDIAITSSLQQGAGSIGLRLLDHLVIGADGAYTSLAELGHVPTRF